MHKIEILSELLFQVVFFNLYIIIFYGDIFIVVNNEVSPIYLLSLFISESHLNSQIESFSNIFMTSSTLSHASYALFLSA